MAWPPADPVIVRSLGLEEVEPGADGRVVRRDVPCRGQVPGLSVAVTVVGDADGAMHVRDDRHRAGVWPRRRRERRPHVAARRAARWVGPMQRRVDRQQVRQEVTAGILQIVDPLHADRPVPPRFDGERRRVVHQQAPLARRRHGAVSPDGGRGQPRRQDLLCELLHRDLVVVRVLPAGERDRPRPWHHRRDQHRRCVLRDRHRIQGAAGNLRDGLPQPSELAEREERQRRSTCVFEKCASRKHVLLLDETRPGASLGDSPRAVTQC